METDSCYEWHRAQQVRMARIAEAMGRVFIKHHEAEQTAEYYELEAEFRQAKLEKLEHDRFDTPDYGRMRG